VPSFRSGRVAAITDERHGLQRVLVDLGGTSPERAYVLRELVGDVAVGDDVVVNTTAVELGLGTGGWHVVHWNLTRRELHGPSPGHVMKLRYTSLQVDSGAAEEHDPRLRSATTIEAMPVVACGLHSQMAGAVAAIAAAKPGARVVYVMSDGGALPLALSDLVAELCDRGLLAATVTAGHAFGGDFEAVNLHDALLVARHAARADVAVVAVGPGIVGTASRFGHTGLDVALALDATAALSGVPIAALRASTADPRERHRGLSHHTATALGLVTHTRACVALPRVGTLDTSALRDELTKHGIDERHELVEVGIEDPEALLERFGLRVRSMGRTVADDPLLFACAIAAGAYASQRLS
jgi:hypothetical protein